MKRLMGTALGIGIVVCARPIDFGQVAGPVAFETLDGHPRVMDNYDARRGTVVVFLSARCMACEKQFDTYNGLHETYRMKDVLFVGVCSIPAESGEELRMWSQHHGCRFPIYRDPTGQVARQFRARVTPEFFLLDRDGKLVYRGALGEKGKSLESAMQILLTGRDVLPVPTEATGTPIDDPGPKREIPDLYGSMSFSSQLIFEKIPGVAVHHCSTLAEAANGDILCLWYGGTYESSEDQALFLARLKKGECAWSEPQRIVWNPEQPPGNAVIFRFPDGRMGIVWGRMESKRPIRRGSGWGECRLMQRVSSDHGQTWSEDVELAGSFGWLPRNAPFTFSDSTFALPISGRVDGRYGSFLLLLNADGVTWGQHGFIPRGEQPTVIQRENGELLCLTRGHPRIGQSVSNDGGATWSPLERIELKCPDSGIAMTKLKSGRVLLVYNDTDQSDRTPFNLIQSRDDGKTWGDMKVLEADWGEFSYPCIIQASDGTIHVSYTYRRYSIKHASFNEGWLTHLERPN